MRQHAKDRKRDYQAADAHDKGQQPNNVFIGWMRHKNRMFGVQSVQHDVIEAAVSGVEKTNAPFGSVSV